MGYELKPSNTHRCTLTIRSRGLELEDMYSESINCLSNLLDLPTSFDISSRPRTDITVHQPVQVRVASSYQGTPKDYGDESVPLHCFYNPYVEIRYVHSIGFSGS